MMERPKKQINVVWCDDNIELLANKTQKETFARHDCRIFRTAKTSNKLKEILATYENFIDAVIVDFNMSDSKEIPGKGDASGFRWIHDNLHNYPSIPFYLFSARDLSFIEEKYQQYDLPIDNDYFLSRNPYVAGDRTRHFQTGEDEEMLDMIVEEVEARCSPTYRIRQEYSEAFAAIDKFGLDGNVFFRILLSDEDIKDYDLVHFANPLRMVIERLFSCFMRNGVIPSEITDENRNIQNTSLNAIPGLLSGKNKYYTCSSPEDRMPKSLNRAFDFFLEFTQDGSHDKDYLKVEFKDYLSKTRDVYFVKVLSIICLDIIKWASSFYDKYKDFKLFKFEPFETKVDHLKIVRGKEGAIAYDDNKNEYFIPQNLSDPYKEGTDVRIEKRSLAWSKEYGNYYVNKATNLGAK